MIRTQIQISEKVAAKLRRMAEEQHASRAELVRRAIELLLTDPLTQQSEGRYERAAAAAGAFSSGLGHLSSEHDRHFAEASQT